MRSRILPAREPDDDDAVHANCPDRKSDAIKLLDFPVPPRALGNRLATSGEQAAEP
jgi:hypothetical protein